MGADLRYVLAWRHDLCTAVAGVFVRAVQRHLRAWAHTRGLGEARVLEFEQRRLHDEAKRPDLARKVEWIAETRGDGAGYDIASFNADASPRLIEVNTTGLGKHFPFVVTANEVRVSEREAEAYSLYRVFDFAVRPRIHALPGSLTHTCRLEATQYRARPECSSTVTVSKR